MSKCDRSQVSEGCGGDSLKVINQTTDWTSGLVKKLIRFQTNPPGLIFRGISRETDFKLEFHPCCYVEKTMNLEEGDEGGGRREGGEGGMR